VFVFEAAMVAKAWLEDFLSIPNFGVKGLSVMIGLTPDKPWITAFGLGAKACLYKGKVGKPDVNSEGLLGPDDAKIVLGATITAQINLLDPMDNCAYFASDPTQMSAILNYVVSMANDGLSVVSQAASAVGQGFVEPVIPDIKIPSMLDVKVDKAMFGMSTKIVGERCMHVSPVLPTGLTYELVASFLGFSIVNKLEMYKTSMGLPKFTYKFELTSNGFIYELMETIRNAVNNKGLPWLKKKCDAIPGINMVCKATVDIVKKLFNVIIDVLLVLFVFHHYKINVPDLIKIATGGDWPSFAVKFEILGVMIDIDINLGKWMSKITGRRLSETVNNFGDMMLKALNDLASFVNKIKEGIEAWLISMVTRVKLGCPEGTERIVGLCYKPCEAHMKRYQTECHSRCPADWGASASQGLFCRRNEYGRGVGWGPAFRRLGEVDTMPAEYPAADEEEARALHMRLTPADRKRRLAEMGFLGSIVKAGKDFGNGIVSVANEVAQWTEGAAGNTIGKFQDFAAAAEKAANDVSKAASTAATAATKAAKDATRAATDAAATAATAASKAADAATKAAKTAANKAATAATKAANDAATAATNAANAAAAAANTAANVAAAAAKTAAKAAADAANDAADLAVKVANDAKNLAKDGAWKACRASKKGKELGCERWGLFIYPKCRAGYSPFGCCICRPKVPDCSANRLGGRFDLACAKKVKISTPHALVMTVDPA